MSEFENLLEMYLNDIPSDEEDVVEAIIHVTPRRSVHHRKVNAQHKDAIRKRLERNGIPTENISNPEKVWKKLSSASHDIRQYNAGRITAGKTRTAREKRQELLIEDDISMQDAYTALEDEYAADAQEGYKKLTQLLNTKRDILGEREHLENLLVVNFKAEEEINSRIKAVLAYWEV